MTLHFTNAGRHVFLPLAFFAAGLAGCTSGKKSTPAPETFPVIQPVIKDTAYVREYVADIQSVQNTEIRARAAGYLEGTGVDEGQFVKAGQLLFSISSKQYEQEVLKAQAAVASAIAETRAAEVELKNTRALVEKNIVSQSELELAQARVEALKASTAEARAQEASAQVELSFTEIRAPFSGYINRIPKKSGSLIEAGTLLTTLSNNTNMLVYFNVSEQEYLNYLSESGEGRPRTVQLRLANGSVYPFSGQVETAESEFDSSTGNLAFRARFPNPEQLLKHGATGKVLVRIAIKNALLIPQKCILEIQDRFFVFEVNESGVVKMTQVVPAYRLPGLFVIGQGLTPDAKIIYEGIQLVAAGQRIDPKLILPGEINLP